MSRSTFADYARDSFGLPSCFAGKNFPGLSQLMDNHDPDMVLVQLGVNDVGGGGTPVGNVLEKYRILVQQMRVRNPNVVVVIAQIHKIITDNCTNQAGFRNAEDLVSAVPVWAEAISTASSAGSVADLWTNSDPADADDCVHPEDIGARIMADNWYDALVDLLW